MVEQFVWFAFQVHEEFKISFFKKSRKFKELK